MYTKVAQRLFEEAAHHYERQDSRMSQICTGLAQLAEAIRLLDERLERIEGRREESSKGAAT